MLSWTALSSPREAVRRLSASDYVAPIGLAVAYYIGARVGFLLTPQSHPISTLWPPNAILLAALLLAPTRQWPVLLAAVFPAHVVIELGSGVPLPMLLCWYVSNRKCISVTSKGRKARTIVHTINVSTNLALFTAKGKQASATIG